jgi:hypothetical protein
LKMPTKEAFTMPTNSDRRRRPAGWCSGGAVVGEVSFSSARCRWISNLPRLRWLGDREALAAISFVWTVLAPDTRSAVKHRPADIVPQSLVVKYELANRLRELVAPPLALESPRGLALAVWRGSACGLDCIGSRTELVRGDVCDDSGLASGIRGMPCCATQVSSRAHGMAARRAGLHHLDLATHPGSGMLDRLARPWVLGLRVCPADHGRSQRRIAATVTVPWKT